MLVQANPLQDAINGLTVGCMSGVRLASTSPCGESWLAVGLQSPPCPCHHLRQLKKQQQQQQQQLQSAGAFHVCHLPANLTGRPEELPPERGQKGAG